MTKSVPPPYRSNQANQCMLSLDYSQGRRSPIFNASSKRRGPKLTSLSSKRRKGRTWNALKGQFCWKRDLLPKEELVALRQSLEKPSIRTWTGVLKVKKKKELTPGETIYSQGIKTWILTMLSRVSKSLILRLTKRNWRRFVHSNWNFLKLSVKLASNV